MRNTPEQISALVEEKDLEGRAETVFINREFRDQDESRLYPVNGRFNVTERAIKRVRARFAEMGLGCVGLEYCLALDSEIGDIVNAEV